jgi:hypothetical protein
MDIVNENKVETWQHVKLILFLLLKIIYAWVLI